MRKKVIQKAPRKRQPLSPLGDLIETVHRLRAPGGCPWDRAQTHQSLRQHLIEETYEVLDVVDQIASSEDLKKERVKAAFQEELGDLMMQVLLHSEMANEVGAFSVLDVAQGLNDKLIRRHPHVFGDAQAHSADHALKNWEKEKAKEKKAPGASCLDGVPKHLPSLQKAARVIEKVTKVGFQWDTMHGPLNKVEEEFSELRTEIFELEEFQKSKKKTPAQEKKEIQIRERIESEMGDLLFTLANVSYLMKINPEDALRKNLGRFEKRFRHVESRIRGQGKTLEQSNLSEMDIYWNEAKALEKLRVVGLTGGIASGKSEVAALFVELGVPVLNADLLAKTISESNPAAKKAIESRFGTTDRKKLREVIFSDPKAKEDLEKILHPLVHEESLKIFQKLASNGQPLVIYEAAILVETGRHRTLDGLIVVDAPEKTRLERLVKRDGISKELGKRMISSQLHDEERNKQATFIIKNNSDLSRLKKQVKEFISQTQLYK
ncbi:MAG: nucleoside triphosphate pyrophosphohydrolase [Bdellovibrio sp.]|nr:nucleoside triphosphate pyrophosphohydrolase [Bdellovibrio sp.]